MAGTITRGRDVSQIITGARVGWGGWLLQATSIPPLMENADD